MVFIVLDKKACKKRALGKCCGTCFWWKFKGIVERARYGDCAGALERARAIIPFAVNLGGAPMVAEHGGKDCPCYRPRCGKK